MTEAGFTGFERGVLGSTAENLSCPICLCRRSSIMRRLPRHARKQNSSRFIKPTPRCFCARMPTTSGRQESINRKNSTATQGAAEREPFVQSGAWGEFPQQAAGEISGCRKSPCSSSLYKRKHCLPSVTSQTRLLLFNKCLWLHKQKIKSHHSSAKSATSLTSLTARASWSLFSSPVFCSMFATWNLTVDISQPISAAMRV